MNTSSIIKPQKISTRFLPWQCILLGNYNIEMYTTLDALPDEWDTFSKKHEPQYCKALIGVAEKAQLVDFTYNYVIVKEGNETVALFYFQNLLLRKACYPDFSDLSFAAKNLYCLIASHTYNLLLNGHIFSTDIPGLVIKKQWSKSADLAMIFEKVVANVKRASDSSIFIVKDANALLSDELLKINSKYKPMPDDVLMQMKVPSTWINIENYIEALSKKYAVRAKKIEAHISSFIIEDFSAEQIAQHAAKLNELYLNVISRSSFKMGVLNMAYFIGMKKAMLQNFNFKVWKLNNEIVGFTTYISMAEHVELYYIGIDYKVNKSHQLYQCMLQQGIKDTIALKKPCLRLGRTAYEAKAIAGATPLIKSNFFQIRNPVLKIGYRYSADYFMAENSTNWQVRSPFK